ncbi:hypothetical protein [Ferroplasma sp.]|uniref:hypothetical protein n=1 Tax=Ferroplasma sp. TaxID=2591003 RepID=UPI00307EF6EE
MNRYSKFFYVGILIVSITYLLIFIIPGKKLITYFGYNYYFGIIPRIFPVFLIFGNVFTVVGLLFPSVDIKKRRIYLAAVAFIFIGAGVLMALILHVSPLNTGEYNGIRSGYLLVEGPILLFFTLVMAYYISANSTNTATIISSISNKDDFKGKDNR